jgi:hypothetical protein
MNVHSLKLQNHKILIGLPLSDLPLKCLARHVTPSNEYSYYCIYFRRFPCISILSAIEYHVIHTPVL